MGALLSFPPAKADKLQRESTRVAHLPWSLPEKTPPDLSFILFLTAGLVFQHKKFILACNRPEHCWDGGYPRPPV